MKPAQKFSQRLRTRSGDRSSKEPSVAAFEALQKEVVNSSEKNRNILVANLFFVAYVLLMIASTSDSTLLLAQRGIRLPLLDVTVSLMGFYWVAPTLLLALHFNLLQSLSVHLSKIAAWRASSSGGEIPKALIQPFIYDVALLDRNFPMGGGLRIVSRLATVWAIPFTLLFTLWRFSDYQNFGQTAFHLLALSVDARLIDLYFKSESNDLWVDRGAAQSIESGFLSVLMLLGVSRLVLLFLAVELGPPPLWISQAYLDDKSRLRWFLPKLDVSMVQLAPKPAEMELDARGDSGAEGKSTRDFIGPSLYRRNFVGARLEYADFRFVGAGGANFNSAQLRGANFSRSDLNRATMIGANLTAVNFSGAFLFEANFRGATAEHIAMHGVRASGLQAQGASFKFADFSGADLQRAQLQAADFEGAHLWATNVAWADFHGADLRNAFPGGVLIYETNFLAAQLDQSVQFFLLMESRGRNEPTVSDPNLQSWSVKDVDSTERVPSNKDWEEWEWGVAEVPQARILRARELVRAANRPASVRRLVVRRMPHNLVTALCEREDTDSDEPDLSRSLSILGLYRHLQSFAVEGLREHHCLDYRPVEVFWGSVSTDASCTVHLRSFARAFRRAKMATPRFWQDPVVAIVPSARRSDFNVDTTNGLQPLVSGSECRLWEHVAVRTGR